jgi:hypothetical protein
MACLLTGVVLAMAVIVPQTFAADEDPSKVEPLPPPLMVMPEAPAPPIFPRVNRYDVWQNYAVDRQGHWRARVIYSPSGAYYLYNHAPYAYTPVRSPLQFMPYAE